MLQRFSSGLRSADATYKSLGILSVCLSTPTETPNIYVKVVVVLATLLRLDILDSYCLMADTVTIRLVKKSVHNSRNGEIRTIGEWSVPLNRVDGHVFVSIALLGNIYFSTAQLPKFRRQFLRP